MVAGIVCLLTFLAPCHAAEYHIVKPAENSRARAAASTRSLEIYENRIGDIDTPLNLIELCGQLSAGDVLVLTFFTDAAMSEKESVQYRIVVAEVNVGPLNIWSVKGRIEHQEWLSFVLTVAPDGYSLHCHDFDNDLIYTATGLFRAGQGRVVEVDASKLPRQLECCGGARP